MTKETLRNYYGLLLEEKQLREQLEIWEARAASSGGNLDGMPRCCEVSDPAARYAVKIAEIKDMLIKKQNEVLGALLEIEKAIEALPRPFYRYIMREYYINDKTWEQIAVDTNYSVIRIWQIHNEALRQLQTL